MSKKIALQDARMILLSGILVNRIAYFLGTYGTLIFLGLGISTERLPLTLLTIGIAAVVGSLAGGAAADRLGGQRSAVTSLLIAALCVGLMAALRTPPLWSEVLAGINVFMMSASIPPVLSALTGGLSTSERVTTFAAYRLALNLGTVICALLAAQLLKGPVQVLLMAESIMCIVTAVIIGVAIGRSGRYQQKMENIRGQNQQSARAGADMRSLLPALALSLMMVPVFGTFIQFTSTIPLTLDDSTQFPILVLVNAGMIILLQVFAGKLASRLPWVIPIVLGILLVSTGLVIMGVSQRTLWLIVGVAIFTLGEMIFAPVTNAVASELSPSRGQGAAQGLIQGSQSAGFSFGPAVGAFFLMRDASSFWQSCFYIGLACAVCIIALYIMSRRRRNGTRGE